MSKPSPQPLNVNGNMNGSASEEPQTPIANVSFEENKDNSILFTNWPIPQYDHYKTVSWEDDIYPLYKPIHGEKFGEANQKEIDFFCDLIQNNKHNKVVDLAIGGGSELYSIYKTLEKRGYNVSNIEGNEVDLNHYNQAKQLFDNNNVKVDLHLGSWEELDKAEPAYEFESFDLAMLLGNSISYIGRETRGLTMQAVSQCVQNFAKLVKKGGYLFIDHRNFDYLLNELQGVPIAKRREKFHFEDRVYYHGLEEIDHFPAYISDSLCVFHYYNHKKEEFSTLLYFPIRQRDMKMVLEKNGFKIEKMYYDFKETDKLHQEPPPKSRFVQFLAKKL